MDKITIVVPIYNKEEKLGNCLKSILNQTYSNFEVIMVNDGSIDNSREIAIEYSKKDKRFVYYEIDNQGVSNARNFGLSKANGEYIAFLDADDEYKCSFLKSMINKIVDNDVCFCNHLININEKKILNNMTYPKNNELLYYIYNKCTPNTNSWLIRKNYIYDNNIYFEDKLDWGEDMIFFSKVLINSNKIAYVDKHLTIYNIQSSNCLSENNLDKIDKDLNWLDYLICYIKEFDLDEKYRNELLSAINNYRKPAAVIYRINKNLDSGNVKELKGIYYRNSHITDNIKVNNGLRSIKLMLYRTKLKIYLWRK